MFRSEKVLRIICFEPVFLAFNPGACPQSHTGQGFSSCIFSCQRAKKLIVLGHFSFQFELWFFLIWSWSIPVGESEIRCSARVFAVSKTAATGHSRHESTKCEQDSKCCVPKRNLGFESLTLRHKKPVNKPVYRLFYFCPKDKPARFSVFRGENQLFSPALIELQRLLKSPPSGRASPVSIACAEVILDL